MITALQRDLGVRYHPGKRSRDVPLEPADCFINGILQGQGGTCGSLPVLYAAVGRRLGYPLRLVTTRSHLFVRWDEGPGGESFNIEAAGEGVSFFPDEHFRTGRFEVPPKAIELYGYLRALSPREELATFLEMRGKCCRETMAFAGAVMAHGCANEIDPERRQHLYLAWLALQAWDECLRKRLPSRRFPKLNIGLPAPQFNRMPRELERDFFRMRIMEILLSDPELEHRWWAPMRKDPSCRPAGLREWLNVDYHCKDPFAGVVHLHRRSA
jgi:hypothetical protein